MSLPFAWMYGDPAEVVDRLRELRQWDEETRARERKRRARRIRKLAKAAMARQLKGQR